MYEYDGQTYQDSQPKYDIGSLVNKLFRKKQQTLFMADTILKKHLINI